MGIARDEMKARSTSMLPKPAPSAPEQQSLVSPLLPSPDAPSIYRSLCALLTSDTGWLRAVPDSGSKGVYLKWKWTAGALSGRYVMAVVRVEDIAEGLELLLEKREAAENGRGTSSLDRPHKG